MTECVRVGLGDRSYDIVVGAGALLEAGSRIAAVIGRRRKLIVVTDEVVAAHGHLAILTAALEAGGVNVGGASVILPSGERTKSFAHLEQLLEGLLGRGIERSTVLVALGGGVIGDLTGFAASVALRGLDFVQIPTTLLAQVDSSVGGKTGINSRHGKNLIGTFHQPRLVLADTGVVDTLEPREVRSGYAEVVKYGLINDSAFFEWLERHGAAVIAGDPEARRYAVGASCRAKAAIVGADEREAGSRALLNLGHTFAHALEAACDFGDTLRHGEAVAIGMTLAFDLSVALGLAPAADALRVFEVGLPTGPGDVPGLPWQPDDLLAHMTRDKKVRDGRITFVLARGIGRSFLADDVDSVEVLRVLAARLVS